MEALSEMDKNIENIKNTIINSDCDICGEKYNKSTRKPVTCAFAECGKSACRECFKRYLGDCELNPQCMWCRKPMTDEFIKENKALIESL